MRKLPSYWIVVVAVACLAWVQPSHAAGGPLASVAWLQQQLGRGDIVLLDASPPRLYAARHIAGAINVDLIGFGADDPTPARMERRIQSWGIVPGKKVVVYDQGGTYLATRLFFDLYRHGVPEADLFLLDGGLAMWQAAGGATTNEPTPPPERGSFRVTRVRDDVRVRLPEFLNAAGDTARHALIDALDPPYHFGGAKFFDRGGHVPHAVLAPAGDFFNADKTFKPAAELRRMMAYLGVRAEQQLHTYCGGGIAASVPWFALKFVAGYPEVKLYVGSQLEWLRDERGLPLWTYAAPYLQREPAWLAGWGSAMVRSFGVSRLSVIDVRSAERHAQGHLPFALNVPAELFRRHLDEPERLAAALGPAGVDPAHEAVIVSERALDPDAALAFVALEALGRKVSLLRASVDDWGLAGYPITREPTVAGPPRSPGDPATEPGADAAPARAGVVVRDPAATRGAYPKVFVAAGRTAPAAAPAGETTVHLPWTALVDAEGKPKEAKDLWNVLAKAGVPRHAELLAFADDPAEAAVAYYVLRLMGWPDVKLWLR